MKRPILLPIAVLTAVVAVFAFGAASSRAALILYTADLSGPAEPTISPGTGFAQVDYDDVLHTIRVQVTFSGLLGNTTASHIHSATTVPGTGTAGVATQVPTFSGFPLGVTAGTYDNTLDLTQASSYNPTFITAHGGTPSTAEAFLVSSFADGTSYLNIHTNQFPGGEIRGFLQPVPEPSALLLGAAGSLGLMIVARKRRKLAVEGGRGPLR
jgi:hypothetical protein